MRHEPHPARSEPGILVTGSGRSGTGWLAAVLKACGVNAGHEAWWTLGERHYGLDVDVSWMGCFDDGYAGRVFAQVRDPRDCIPSIYANEWRHQYHVIRAQNVRLSGDWAVDACRIWVDYTRHAVERAEAWWRLESVKADRIAETFRLHPFEVERAIADTAPLNAKPSADFEWPNHEVTDEALELGRELGYP